MPRLSHAAEARRDLIQRVLDGEVLLRPVASILRPGLSQGNSAPVSYWQLHIWQHAQLAARLAPGVNLFNETITIHRSGDLDVDALQKSLNEIMRRHQAWRTTFRLFEGEPRQFVSPFIALPLPVTDLTILPDPERTHKAHLLGTRDARESFDLEEGPLVRTRLVRLAAEEWKLFLTVHQILLDGVSVYSVLLPELVALYEAFSHHQPSPLPEISIQYPDYAIWQRRSAAIDGYRNSLAYWELRLKDAPRLRLPSDYPPPKTRTFRGSIFPFALPARLSADALSYSHAQRVTLFTTLSALFQVLLQRYTGQEDVVVGTIVPTRPTSELQGLLGYFLNPVALRLDLTGNPSFNEVVHRARSVFVEALSNSDVPFDIVAQRVGAQSPAITHPIYQVQVSLEPPLPSVDRGWSLTPMDFESGGTKLDLYMVFDARSEGILGRVQYNPDLYRARTIARMVEHYTLLLDWAVSRPESRLSDFPQLQLLS